MKKRVLKNLFIILLFYWFIPISLMAQFVHPGIWHKKSDLDRMKSMVEAKKDPWYSSYVNLANNAKSSYDYVVRKDAEDDSLSRENPRHQRYEYESDAIAAYQNSLMWYITGDARHAEKAIEILNAWSSLVNFYGGGTEPLCAGLYGAPLINAAEIIKSTYDGWDEAEIQAFKDMLVYPGYSSTTVPQDDIDNDNVTFYWRVYNGDPGRHGNQGLLAWRTVMAMGIFLDNEVMYDRALRQVQGLPHRSDDLAYPSGPPIVQTTPNSNSNEYYNEYTLIKPYRDTAIEDYGYDDQIEHYIYDNGQCQESSRDQVHSSLGLSTVVEIMEMAWNQGTDLYSFLDHRIVKGLEFTLKYNLSEIQSYEDQLSPWEPETFYQYTTRTGRWKSLKINPWVSSDLERNSRGVEPVVRPVLEMPVAHFTVRQELADEAKWTVRSRDYAVTNFGYEQNTGTDAPGWGGLSFRRPPWCAGDPISGFENDLPVFEMNVLPGTIEAENYDYFVEGGESRVYHDTDDSNSGENYRTDQGVDIGLCSEGGYALTDMDQGEWMTYTCDVSEPGIYSLDVRYAAVNSSGTICFKTEASNLTEEVTLVSTGGLTSWATQTISDQIVLSQGVQAIRIYVGGADDSYTINNFSFSLVQANTAPVVSVLTPAHQDVFVEGESLTLSAAASDAEGAITKVQYYAGAILLGEVSEAPYSFTWKYLPKGTYSITAVAIDNDRAMTTSEEVNITVESNGKERVSLDLEPIADTYVHSGEVTTNYGSATSMVTKSDGSGDGRYIFLKFDLGEVKGAISSAELTLYRRSGSSEKRAALQVSDDSWTEEGVIWTNQPSLGEVMDEVFVVNSGTWDVSDFVAIENGTDSIVTICIRDLNNTGNGIDFYAKENESSHPVLKIKTTADIDAGVYDKTSGNGFFVYPNPVTNQLNIKVSNLNYSSLSIHDLSGRLIAKKEVDAGLNEYWIDMNDCEKGIYVVELKGNYTTEVLKVVKK